jgi:hypothetical protein
MSHYKQMPIDGRGLRAQPQQIPAAAALAPQFQTPGGGYLRIENEVTGAVDGVIEMQKVDLPIRKQPTAGEAAREYSQQSVFLNQQLIKDAPKVPPLLVEEASEAPAIMDMGADFAGKVRVELHIVGVSDEDELDELVRGEEIELGKKRPAFDITVPLRMMQYKLPADPRTCFDVAVCKAVDAENDRFVQHNKYITSLLSLFVRQNGCGTSAGHITNPSPPQSLMISRAKRLEDIFNDKYASTCLAVRYLCERGRLCGKDYEFEEAVTTANAIAYEETLAKKKANGKIRFRLEGSPYATWSGNDSDRDSLGRRVKFQAAPMHSFISPEVAVVLARDELAAP